MCGGFIRREQSQDMQQQSTSPCQGACKGSATPKGGTFLSDQNVMGHCPRWSLCPKQKCQLLPCANILWCPPTRLPLHSSATPGNLLVGQRAAHSTAGKAFTVSHSLSSSWKPAVLVNGEKMAIYWEKELKNLVNSRKWTFLSFKSQLLRRKVGSGNKQHLHP